MTPFFVFSWQALTFFFLWGGGGGGARSIVLLSNDREVAEKIEWGRQIPRDMISLLSSIVLKLHNDSNCKYCINQSIDQSRKVRGV